MNKKIKLDLKNLKFEEVLERQITVFGNSAHIIVPQKHKNKKAAVIVLK